MKKSALMTLATLLLLSNTVVASAFAENSNPALEVVASATVMSSTYGSDAADLTDSEIYELELQRWNVYDDGTHPVETTNGINNALKWAASNGKTTVKIPDGTYLIAKGVKNEDTAAAVNLVSNLVLELSPNTLLQKETNGYEGYSLVFAGKEVKNAAIKGGTLRGERDTHDYSQKTAPWSAGTHEWGYGINMAGAENIIVDGVKIENFTGDGISISGATQVSSMITEEHLEFGGLDDNGKPIADTGKVRSKNRTVTNFDNPKYKEFRNLFMWLPKGLAQGSKFDVYYYRADGSFIKADKQLKFYSGESTIPDDADYFRSVYEVTATTLDAVSANRMTVDNSKKIVVKNCDIGYNRRQGITAGGEDVQIINNYIHHIGGTSPSAGIDIEPGYYPAKNHFISGNRFVDNKIQMVLSYGENVVIEKNYFEQNNIPNGIGLTIHPGYRGQISVQNNEFVNSSLTVNPDNAVMNNNNIENSRVILGGKDQIFDNATLMNSSLKIGTNSGQKISNVSIVQNGGQPYALHVGDKQIALKDISINATVMTEKKEALIQGNGTNENVYDNLTVEDGARRGTLLPAGTYNNSSFSAGALTINREGQYNINYSNIKDNNALLKVIKTYGAAPSVTIKNTNFELTENVGYGAAIHVQGATEFNLYNSTVLAKNHSNLSTPIIKLGPLGSPKPTQIFGATIYGNSIYGKTGISTIGIDTSNAGIDAPQYKVVKNTMYNTKLKLKTNDLNLTNTEVVE
jgi:hypothetical protein